MYGLSGYGDLIAGASIGSDAVEGSVADLLRRLIGVGTLIINARKWCAEFEVFSGGDNTTACRRSRRCSRQWELARIGAPAHGGECAHGGARMNCMRKKVSMMIIGALQSGHTNVGLMGPSVGSSVAVGTSWSGGVRLPWCGSPSSGR